MKIRKPIVTLAAAGLLFSAGIGLTSCSNDITEEQLLELNTIKKEQRSLNRQLETKKGELAEIERELKAQTDKLDDCSERQRFVREKLEKWPDVWPDWSPEDEKKSK